MLRPFVLYSLRHTFLARLGQSGCDVWTLARVAGHSSIAISARYVHPSEDAVLEAMERLGGHNSGHSSRSEAAHRTSLAKGEVGIREKRAVPILSEFCRKRLAPWVESTSSLKTWRDFYRVGLLAIQAYPPLRVLNWTRSRRSGLPTLLATDKRRE